VKPTAKVPGRFLLSGVCVLLFGSLALAGTEKILHTFAVTDGDNPYTGVVFDGAGNLYGTTFYGGSTDCNGAGCGVVFKLAPAAGGGLTETTIYAFTGGADGSHPYSPLVFDAAGNLYGATYGAYFGGTGQGTVFKLTPNADSSWSFVLLHAFAGGQDGAQPNGPLALDAAGNLYGTTNIGGSHGAGIAFGLAPNSHGPWKESLLHVFTGGQDGSAPFGLISDAAGNLYGAATFGGTATCSCGVVYQLSPVSSGGWKETVLHRFTGESDGGYPGSLALSSSGQLYGAAETGGRTIYCSGGCGVVFRLTAGVQGAWSETILHKFNGVNGVGPGGLVFDSGGQNLYGSTFSAGYAAGLIFDLAASDNWTETVIYDFPGGFDDGAKPIGPLVLDRAGNVYGTTIFGGSDYAGVVFEVTP
jgi:uncharacterized repeat protein (TIGR03803 family)